MIFIYSFYQYFTTYNANNKAIIIVTILTTLTQTIILITCANNSNSTILTIPIKVTIFTKHIVCLFVRFLDRSFVEDFSVDNFYYFKW